MARKTTTTTGRRGNAGPAQETDNQLYTAHQVHTLAQMMFQQLSFGRQPGVPWQQHGPGMTAQQPAVGQGSHVMWPTNPTPGAMPTSPQAVIHTAPQGLVYWYP